MSDSLSYLRLHLQGTRPLLMHNIQAVNPLNPATRALKEATSKRKKTDEDLVDIFALEFQAGLYHDPEIGPYIPGHNVKSCLVEAARMSKQGKDIIRAVTITDELLPLAYDGPRDLADLLAQLERFSDVRAVRVMSARTMRCRPCFREWALHVDVALDRSVMDPDDLVSIAVKAGLMVGLGDFRQQYGRFSVSVEAVSA